MFDISLIGNLTVLTTVEVLRILVLLGEPLNEKCLLTLLTPAGHKPKHDV